MELPFVARNASYLEPYTRNSRVTGFSRLGTTVAVQSGEPPRAALLVSNDLIVWPLTELSSRDLAVAKIQFDKDELVVASIYMPHDTSLHPSLEFRQLLRYCEAHNSKLIVGGDINSHHTMWGSTDCNERGDDLVDFLATSQLHVANQGHSPTFVTSTRREVLDTTFASTNALSLINDWKVDDKDSFSDHRQIRFKLGVNLGPPVMYYNRKKTDLTKYREVVEPLLDTLETSEITSVDSLEKRTEKLSVIIRSGFYASCPRKRVRPGKKLEPWWTDELKAQRKEARCLLRRALLTCTQEDWEKHKQARNAFTMAIRKAKRNAWRSFCAGMEKMSDAARLCKILKSDPIVKLGSLQKDDGSFTRTADETLDLLLQTHFSNSTSGSSNNREAQRIRVTEGVVTPHKIRAAFETFSAFKSAGPDEIFPALLTSAGQKISKVLAPIYTACLEFGYTPKSWRQAIAVFLPKPGKDSYQRASSWRPISLTSFLLKGLERLVDWHVKDADMVSRLKASRQFAYLRGVSTEAALHQLTLRIERTLQNKEVALGVFLDIEGAFNKVPYDVISRCLHRLKVDPLFVRWINSMLRDRSVTADLFGSTRINSVGAGCPQGGVLSPFIWDCVVDELLTELMVNATSTYSQGFADDIALLQSGICYATVQNIMQQSLRVIHDWCTRVGLSVNASKSEAVVFTNRKRLDCRKILLFNGQPIPFKTSVRYLGVHLDHKLTWRIHTLKRAMYARIALAQCKRAVSRTWGLEPRVMRWIYTAIIRPAIFYGAIVWVPAMKAKNNIATLTRIQRTAMLLITGCMHTTPTAALEGMLDLLPVDVHAELMAVRTMHRLKHNKTWMEDCGGATLKQVTHTRACGEIWKRLPVLEWPCDLRNSRPLVEGGFQVTLPTKDEWKKKGEPQHADEDVVCYTDGSRHNERTGAAYTASYDGEHASELIALGTSATVFQAEVLAINNLARALLEAFDNPRSIFIYSDSRSALSALLSWQFMTALVGDCFESLRQLAVRHSVTLTWIPAHAGYSGNEMVDELAKSAAELIAIGPEPIIPVSVSAVHSATQKWADEKHALLWRNRSDCQQTKLLIELPSRVVSRFLTNCPRGNLRQFVQIMTGHSVLKGHLYKLGVVDSNLCPYCEMEPETSLHFLGKCDKYVATRCDVLEGQLLSPESIRQATPARLLSFIKSSGRLRSYDHDQAEVVRSAQRP